MRKGKFSPLILTLGGTLILLSLIFLWPPAQANAQCGSQASSCKNCHEVQGQDPVNNDGTGWHQSHAFGDFCYICHAGNNQSIVEEEAHAGMVAPLSDVQAGCQSCHPNDLMERAEVYAVALGVEIGSGGGGASTSSPDIDSSATSSSTSEQPSVELPAGEMIVESDELVDYGQQYDETVLGKRTVNWGNVILVGLILLVAIGGGAFVVYNERKLRGLPLLPGKKKEITTEAVIPLPQVEGYPPEVVSLLPKLRQLNPVGLHALDRILENPDQASTLLHSLSRLDPDLIQRMRSLDRETRALLLAMAGD